MDNNDKPNQKITIPKVFHQHTTGQPFQECISCGKVLYTSQTPYMIEKAIKQYKGYHAKDVVFEYAMCLDCAEMMRQKMSLSSLRDLDAYFSDQMVFDKRDERMAQTTTRVADEWINRCIVKDTPVKELAEFQLCAFCQGQEIIPSIMPYMVSGQAIDEMGMLLSNKTKGEMDDFVDENFGLPPELREIIKEKDMVLF